VTAVVCSEQQTTRIAWPRAGRPRRFPGAVFSAHQGATNRAESADLLFQEHVAARRGGQTEPDGS